ncbi:MAG TPA: glycine--tRNA ligase subunit beta [Woeseiaceae bacterium]|nr:glycine--tRNA ligase subunit beta [Woeseiaceae bacterium]
MAKPEAADFLVEIGTEELPPTALRDLMLAFSRNVDEALEREHLSHSGVSGYASPRRLAVLVTELASAQPDRAQELKGPPVSVAFDAGGLPTQAARAFADRCGVAVEALERTKSAKGEWLCCRTVLPGKDAALLLPEIVAAALQSLPVPRRMRWGDADYEFVRPVHWVVMLHGRTPVKARLFGLESRNVTYGHRFLAPGEIVIDEPAHYLSDLESKGFVIADYARRRQRIVDDVAKAAADAGGAAVAEAALYDEVTALTEWPVPVTGSFDDAFLALPREVVVATLTSHQRYFPIEDAGGNLLPRFVTIANLPSKEPEKVRDGNERVVRPRLADAAFFWQQDQKMPLEARRRSLRDIVYQEGLGSIGDRSERVARLGVAMASRVGVDAAVVERAALLAKCDLLTGMVGEFPELQGVMGGYYAKASGEPDAVAAAIAEQYLPRFSGDALPETPAGQILAIAEKMDSLAGIFALGKKPSGNRDPFGLRRGALGVVRIIVEKQLDLNLVTLIEVAYANQPAQTAGGEAEIYDFLLERMRAYSIDSGVAPEVFEAVRARRPSSLTDFDARAKAVTAFLRLDAAASLAAANKRIANILRQAGIENYPAIDTGLLSDEAEKDLYSAVQAAKQSVAPLLEERAYAEALKALAELRQPVDKFFDQVLVMADEAALRQNRLALLAELRALFFGIADISRLATG